MEIVRNAQAPLVPEWVKDTHIGNNLKQPGNKGDYEPVIQLEAWTVASLALG